MAQELAGTNGAAVTQVVLGHLDDICREILEASHCFWISAVKILGRGKHVPEILGRVVDVGGGY